MGGIKSMIKPILGINYNGEENITIVEKDLTELETNYQEAIENIEAIKHKLDKGLDIKYIKNFVNIICEELK